jgi:hypothetical protein
VVYVPKIPRWVEPMPSPNPWEPESFHKSCYSGVLPDKISTLQLYQSERWMKWYALKKWESTLNFVFMPMEMMQTVSKASCKMIIHLYDSFGILNLILCSYGSDHAVLIQYIWKIFIPVPPQFYDKVEVSAIAGQWPSSTSVMFYLRVLPPGISRISCHCNTSFEL